MKEKIGKYPMPMFPWNDCPRCFEWNCDPDDPNYIECENLKSVRDKDIDETN